MRSKLMVNPYIGKLSRCLAENRDDSLRKICNKIGRKEKQRVVEQLFKQADNLTLIKRLYEEIKFRKRRKLIKILVKEKERVNVLEWYIHQLVLDCKILNDEDEDDETELLRLSRKLFKPMRYALINNTDAFHIIATKLQIQQDPMLLLRFIEDTPLTAGTITELTKLDINGYFGYIGIDCGSASVICKLDILKQLKNHIQRIAYILDNLKFRYNRFDPDKFDECCVCLEKPIDVVINKCGHFTCSKCFFTIMDRTMFKVVCPVCRSTANGVYELEYAHYPLSLTDEPTDVFRHGRTVITIESNGHATIYT